MSRPNVGDIPALIDRARRDLDRARDIGEVLRIRDAAEAMRTYTKRRKGLIEAHNRLMCVLALCERKIGVELRKMLKHPPGPAPRKKIDSSVESIPEPPTLRELGLTRREAWEFQGLAKVPEATIVAAIERAGAEGRRAGRRDYLAAAKDLTADGTAPLEAKYVKQHLVRRDSMRPRNKLDTWLGHGWAIIRGMGAHLLEHPEEFSMLDLGQLDLVTRFLHRALYLARVDRAKRTSRPRLSTVVDFPSTKDPPDEDEPA